MLLVISHAAGAAGTLLVFGDSLSAGFGLRSDQAWPVLLGKRLEAAGKSLKVVNASISGETTAGGRARLEAALRQHQAQTVIIELGANDGLRGLPTAAMRDNLMAMVQIAQRHKVRILLIGMRLPPNYGSEYTRAFDQTFVEVARKTRVPLLPFLLEPIAADRNAFQADGLHPVAEAQPKILDHVWKILEPMLKPVSANRT